MTEKLARIRSYCSLPASSVLFDEAGKMLLDVPSGKRLELDLTYLEQVELRSNLETGKPYLAISFGDGRRFALSEAGIAFAPSPRHGLPAPELPRAVCWRDFALLVSRLEHELYAHPEFEPTRQPVDLVMLCISILDGARAVGFEVGREERRLEQALKVLEGRMPRKS
jgi:hypothetical protein